MLRRIGAIGDIHTEDERLAASLAFLRQRGVEKILSVGDIADGRGDINRCCALLDAPDVVAVRGNHDRWLLGNDMRVLRDAQTLTDLAPTARRFLGSLTPTYLLSTIAGDLLLCHAVGTDDMIRLREDDDGYALTSNDALQTVLASGVPFMVCGHTHQPMVRALSGLTIINAGTLHRDFAPCFCEIDFEGRAVQFFDIEDPHAIRDSLRFTFGAPGQDVWGRGV